MLEKNRAFAIFLNAASAELALLTRPCKTRARYILVVFYLLFFLSLGTTVGILFRLEISLGIGPRRAC